ncbi:MAG: HAD-IA family hydrolase [Opitutales bacterium]|nr:HAD-IA family hydrolase [Opitutales bacterium]
MPTIKVVSFDLTGTLLALSPSLGEICAGAMRELGLADIPAAKIFDARKKHAQRVVRANGLSPTSEARSREYWRAMLWEIFEGAVPTALFPQAKDLVYARIADASSWRAAPDAKRTLESLRFLGVRCVVISNGDSRWRNALNKLGLTTLFDKIFLSSETGFAKPDTQAFDNVCLAMKIRRGELLHVGDSLSHDVVPAHAIGAEAVWLTRSPDGAPPEQRVSIIENLGELPRILQARLCEGVSRAHFPRSTRNLLALLRGLPEEQQPDPHTVVVKKNSSESAERKWLRTENAAYTTDRDFVVPANTMDDILKSHGIFGGSLQSQIRENWGKIVPATLVSRCAPTELRDGFSTLVVACENAVIRQQIEFRKRTMLKRINTLPGCEKVQKIIFSNEFSG